MLLLSKTKNKDYKFILSPKPYDLLYSRLKSVLPEYYKLFAKPTISGQNTYWYLEDSQSYKSSDIKSFNDVSEDTKDMVSDYLATAEPAIISILSNVSDLKDLSHDFLKFPNFESVKVIETDYEPIVILTSWACVLPGTTQSEENISEIIKRPKPNRADVVINVSYTDGSVAKEKDFYYDSESVVKNRKKMIIEKRKKTTNEKGIRSLGAIKLGTEITVYDLVDDEKVYLHNFQVEKDAEYNVVFPLFADAKVKVFDQKDKLMPNVNVEVEYQEDTRLFNTETYGFFSLSKLEVGREIKIIERNNPENYEIYTVRKDKNEFKLVIYKPVPTDCIIVVYDEVSEQNLPNYPVMVEYDGNTNEYSTGEADEIKIDELIAGKEIKIYTKNNPENIQQHRLAEHDNYYVLHVSIPKAKFFDVPIIGEKHWLPFLWVKKWKYPNVKVDFITKNGEKITRTTDENSICRNLPEDEFDDNQKVKVIIHTKTSRNKEKLIKKSFKFRKSTES